MYIHMSIFLSIYTYGSVPFRTCATPVKMIINL